MHAHLRPPTATRPTERILYVDDDGDAREAFAAAAVELGFIVDTAEGGGEALSMASRHRYAVIAADLRMPTLNGLSLIQLLRPKRPDASYLIVTGASHLELPAQSNGAPLVDAVVPKPWSLSQLAQTLNRALDQFRTRVTESSIDRTEAHPVLLVAAHDEAAKMRELLDDALPGVGVATGACVDEALAMVEAEQFGAALVHVGDAESPATSIAALCERSPGLPVVLLGERDEVGLEERVRASGASDYLVSERIDAYHLRRALHHAQNRKQLEARLEFLSLNDPLTGLSNRASLGRHLVKAMERADESDTRFAVLLLDLDYFSRVNDSLGHEIGDELLTVVSQRIRENLRDIDVAARLNGDEFAIVLEGLRDEEEAIATAQRLLEALTPPARLKDYEIVSTGSIGIAVYPQHGEPEELIRRAERAMYRAKQNGRDGFELYTVKNEESRSGVLQRLHFESGIRHALERDEYVVFFQPQLTLDRNELVAVEALIRWNHPTAGLVPPGRFMPFLESSGLIKGVGDWVLQRACAQSKAWRDAGHPSLRVSVNLSARQFEGTDLVSIVELALERSGLPATALELEITESLLMKDVERTRQLLHALKALGVRIAIDDFGTGYSSLAYLTTFPLDCLKIDRSFVHDITTNDNDRTVAEAIIGLGHKLRLDVVAEGVETEAQLGLLRGCDGFQGFLVSQPKPADQMDELMARFATG